MLELVDDSVVCSLATLAGQVEQAELSFHAALVIKHLLQHSTYQCKRSDVCISSMPDITQVTTIEVPWAQTD